MGHIGTASKWNAHSGLKGIAVIQLQVIIALSGTQAYQIFQFLRVYQESGVGEGRIGSLGLADANYYI